MTDVKYVCNPVDVFQVFELPAWLAREQEAGRAPAGRVSVTVMHPDREIDGSCRWCGGGANSTVVVEDGRLV